MGIQYCCFIFSTYSSFASDGITDPWFLIYPDSVQCGTKPIQKYESEKMDVQ